MAKIYKDANDQYVAATIVYNDGTDTKAYKDAECEVQFTTSELKDAFIKGAVINITDVGLVKPIKYAEDSSVGSIYYITPNETTATSADIAALSAIADD